MPEDFDIPSRARDGVPGEDDSRIILLRVARLVALVEAYRREN